MSGSSPSRASGTVAADEPVVSGVRSGDLSGPLVLAVVVLTRVLTAWNWIAAQDFGFGDVNYYWTRITRLEEVGLGDTLREYPTPVTWLLAIPDALPGTGEASYVAWFVTLVLLTELLFCLMLWRSRAPWRGWAIVVWSLLCLFLGPLVWLRFDIVPAVTVGMAILLAVRRPGVSGVALAVGGAVKLWPATLFPLLLNRPEGRPRSGARPPSWAPPLIGFGATGLIVVIASLAAGGWTRLVSPLTWQSDRGLQIESIPATPVMALRAADPQTWSVRVSQYQAFEIFGPGVAQWQAVSTALTVLGAIIAILLIVAHLRRPYANPRDWAAGVAVAMFGIIALLIVTNKTLSPQYLIWLGGPLTALVAWQGPRVRPVLRWTLIVLASAAVTHLVYPVFYDYVNGLRDHPIGTPWGTAALAGRNLLLLVLTADLVLWGLRRRSVGDRSVPE